MSRPKTLKQIKPIKSFMSDTNESGERNPFKSDLNVVKEQYKEKTGRIGRPPSQPKQVEIDIGVTLVSETFSIDIEPSEGFLPETEIPAPTVREDSEPEVSVKEYISDSEEKRAKDKMEKLLKKKEKKE